MQYRDSGTRWMEKQEARSLRMALEDMDLEDEKKVHSDAQDEAAELVWKHKNPDAPGANPHAPYPNPDSTQGRKDYRAHMKRGSYQQMQDQEQRSASAHRMSSGGSQRALDMASTQKVKSLDALRKISPPAASVSHKKQRTPSGKSYGGLAEAVADDIAKAQRRVSSGNKRIMSGDKRFYMHPNDRIWEDPTEQTKNKKMMEPPKLPAPSQPAQPAQSVQPAQPAHAASIRKNPFARVRMQADQLERARSEPILSSPTHNRVEIQRNPPSQSKNPWYMSNEPLPPTPPKSPEKADDEVAPKTAPNLNIEGRERRGDDIRAATSKQRSQYSPGLPRPTMVSDKPGRPIVSFVEDKPKEVVLEERRFEAPSMRESRPQPSRELTSSKTPGPAPTMVGAEPSFPFPKIGEEGSGMPPIPTINVPDDPAVPGKTLSETPDIAPPQMLGGPPSPPVKFSTPSSKPSQPAQSPFHSPRPPPPSKGASDAPAPLRPSRRPFQRPDSSYGDRPSSPLSSPSGSSHRDIPPSPRSPRPNNSYAQRPASPQSPSINVNSTESSKRPSPASPRALPSRPPPSSRPLPNPSRPLPHHAATSPLPKSTPHYTPTPRHQAQTGVLCAACALPIAGRVLSAGGERFHPECFTCHICATNLELVAFYPEPRKQAHERHERIIARQQGADIPIPDGHTAATMPDEVADGDASPRFYCHLDFHETFSPRCKSCSTPIEGEVVVACGAEYHVGHFFCAQCGDPFDSTTPFVEKDGYAWCVGCHTHRYSTKCRKCRKPVTETVVKALGADWHEGCFVCLECNGDFVEGKYFLRGASQDPVCVRCEKRRLKA